MVRESAAGGVAKSERVPEDITSSRRWMWPGQGPRAANDPSPRSDKKAGREKRHMARCTYISHQAVVRIFMLGARGEGPFDGGIG